MSCPLSDWTLNKFYLLLSTDKHKQRSKHSQKTSYYSCLDVIFNDSTVPLYVKLLVNELLKQKDESQDDNNQEDKTQEDKTQEDKTQEDSEEGNNVEQVSELFDKTQSHQPSKTFSPEEFHTTTFRYAIKALSTKLMLIDIAYLNNMIKSFTPESLAEQLDMMAAQLLVESDLKNEFKQAALKLSLSRIISCIT